MERIDGWWASWVLRPFLEHWSRWSCTGPRIPHLPRSPRKSARAIAALRWFHGDHWTAEASVLAQSGHADAAPAACGLSHSNADAPTNDGPGGSLVCGCCQGQRRLNRRTSRSLALRTAPRKPGHLHRGCLCFGGQKMILAFLNRFSSVPARIQSWAVSGTGWLRSSFPSWE